ncbi:MAG: nitrogen fixation protein NifM [Thiotrichaceae bacterium]
MKSASPKHFFNYLILRTALNNYQKSPEDLSPSELEQIQYQVRHQFELETKILASQDATEVIVPLPQLEAALTEIRARYEDEEEFAHDLAKNDLDIDGFQAALYRELKVGAILEHVAARATEISETEVNNYYHTHEAKFHIPETRTVRHILITINEDYEENHREAARERILHLSDRLKHHPEQFPELAQRHSECATALQGGLLGRVQRGQLYAELDEILFMMQEAQISQPVESELGFRLLYCEKIHVSAHIPLADAYPKILELLQKRQRVLYQKSWLAQL